MKHDRFLRFACALMLGVVFIGAAPGRSSRMVADWMERLRSADQQLRSGQWREGTRAADSVLSEMRSRIESGKPSGALLATALLFKAIGQAGSGYQRAAAWNFGIAQVLNSDLVDVDLSPYGAPGRSLEYWRYTSLKVPRTSPTPVPPVPSRQPGMQPPTKIRGSVPDYPYAKAAACAKAVVLAQAVINESGQPELPYVLQPTDPVLTLAALEALGNWQFRPATLDGKPVRVYFVLTVTFHCK